MKNALLALFVVPLLTVPAFAGSSSVGDKPMGVADAVVVGVGPVGVGVASFRSSVSNPSVNQQ
jgi:uncharacterized membrane protein YhiD involved in acid resistance